MLLYKPKKNQKNQTAKGDRLLITVNVVGSAGPLRFVVFEEELVSKVIDTALKNFAREGRLPVLGTDLDEFVLYCPNARQQRLNPCETIGSFGSRNFMLCKKPESEKFEKDEGDEMAADAVSCYGTGSTVRKVTVTKRFGVWKSWINKPPRLKITSH